ncbi:BlaI/MecI/CopY family transcriptional regulator [Stieleria sp. ICT_E10.1]|uniref:BlaI/MecI/CopY family transcriptional regulator n=1 Tax=Stieleria sedimenti TaxID=2976331 RepID=UPI00217F8D0F|nr:BlaI/MecI/CopY family transcriptional regulator [Stieleria sedimenti]MCS7469687.1 BlaI/MecI/CopY family transcriptional regulator [Stieleria sedimenti]
MPRRVSKHPTELELEILQVLWDSGPLSGQAVRDALEPTRSLTYQSVMTILGIMEEKKFVVRKKSGGRFEYRAKVTKSSTAKRMMRDLVDRLFDGSAATAMINLLEAADLSDQELAELRAEVNRSQNKDNR